MEELSKVLTEQIKQALSAVVTQTEEPNYEFSLTRPNDIAHGDLSSNVAMINAKKLGVNPKELAIKLVAVLKNAQIRGIKEIEIAGPGFINIQLEVEPILTAANKNINLSSTSIYAVEDPKELVVEMGDTNTHKFPHIGHLFNYITGDSIARLKLAGGHKVHKVAWQGDVGPHVAKCLWGWRKLGKPQPEELVTKMQLLQQAYSLGNKHYDEDETAKAEIQQLNKQIYDQDESIVSDWQLTKDWSLQYDAMFEAQLGIKLENRYLEGDLWPQGQQQVEENLKSSDSIFKESEGAIIFAGEEHGLHTRVFITKQGTPTYETKEIGLAIQKLKDYPAMDLTIIPTASEQNHYFKVVFKAISGFIEGYKGQNKLAHVGTGMFTLTSGKMGSRSGNIITAYDLITEIKQRVSEVLNDREGLDESEKEDIINKVALGAIKYSFLKGNILQNFVFDMDASVSFEGNSGPYLQYTYARIASILRQTNTSELLQNLPLLSIPGGYELSPAELDLVKQLPWFTEAVKAAARIDVVDNVTTHAPSPHLVATYLFDLAQKFNSFYKLHSVNSAESSEISEFRKGLSAHTAAIIRLGLGLLGIDVPEKM